MKALTNKGVIIDIRHGQSMTGTLLQTITLDSKDVAFLNTDEGAEWFRHTLLLRLCPWGGSK